MDDWIYMLLGLVIAIVSCLVIAKKMEERIRDKVVAEFNQHIKYFNTIEELIESGIPAKYTSNRNGLILYDRWLFLRVDHKGCLGSDYSYECLLNNPTVKKVN